MLQAVCTEHKAILEESERRQDELVARRAHALQQRAEKVWVIEGLFVSLVHFHHVFINGKLMQDDVR